MFVYESFFVILRSKVREYPLLLDAKVIIKMETSKKSGTNIVKNYVRYLKLERNFTANTLEAYQRDLRYLLNFVKSKEMSLLDVKLEDLEEFSASLHDKGVRPALAKHTDGVVCFSLSRQMGGCSFASSCAEWSSCLLSLLGAG